MFISQNTSIPKRALFNASLTFIYVLFVASIPQMAQALFSQIDNPGLWGPAAFLLLFVISAAITGSLVLGKPFLMYLDGQKKEAVELFVWTLGFLFLFLVVLAGVILLVLG